MPDIKNQETVPFFYIEGVGACAGHIIILEICAVNTEYPHFQYKQHVSLSYATGG